MAFNLRNANDQGTVCVRPALRKLLKIVCYCAGCRGLNILPFQIPAAVDCERDVHGFVLGTINLYNMPDRCKSQTFTGVPHGVDGRLHQLYKSGGRLAQGTVEDHELDRAAYCQLALRSSAIHSIQPVFYASRCIREGFQPFVSTFRRNKTRRRYVSIPCAVHSDSAHAGNRIDLFEIVLLVATVSLRVQAAEITLPKNLGILFVLTGDEQCGDGTGLKAGDIFDGNTGVAVIVACFAGCLACDLIHTGRNMPGYAVIQRSNGKTSTQRKSGFGRGDGQFQHGGRRSLRGKPTLSSSPQKIFPTGCVSEPVVERFFDCDVQIDDLHSTGCIGIPEKRTFPGVQIAGNAGHFPFEDSFISLF
nr:MAG TPA_asm: hypothetical protein [Caudoviricetes sp.]